MDHKCSAYEVGLDFFATDYSEIKQHDGRWWFNNWECWVQIFYCPFCGVNLSKLVRGD
jgi:hypothetical protein